MTKKAEQEWTVAGAAGEVWDRKEVIQGVYLRKKEGVGINNSNLYKLQTDDGLVGVWGGTVINSKMEDVPLGSEVRITPLGEKESDKGKKYNDYNIEYRPAPFKNVDDKEPLPDEPEVAIEDIKF